MKTYNFIYTETKKQVWTLILAPLLLVFLFISVLLNVNLEGDVPLILFIIVFISTIAFTMWWLLNKVVARKTNVTVTQNGFNITLDKTNFLFPHKEMNIDLSNIKKFSSDFNVQAGNRQYFTIETKTPSRSFTLSQPKAMSFEDSAEFEEVLSGNIAGFNQTITTPSEKIQEGSFFDAPWAKWFTYVMYAALAAVTISFFMGKVPWYRCLQIYVLSFVWIASYQAGRNRKKKVV